MPWQKNCAPVGQGVKHFSFSDCAPSYSLGHDFSKCSRWYNESVDYILNDERIKTVLLNHRYSKAFFGGNKNDYPNIEPQVMTEKIENILLSMDKTIHALSEEKDNVYVFYPVPELNKNVQNLIGHKYRKDGDLTTVAGTSLEYYKKRNAVIIQHFDNANYPSNVHLVRPENAFCAQESCYSVLESKTLYFDGNHPSVTGAEILVGLIPEL